MSRVHCNSQHRPCPLWVKSGHIHPTSALPPKADIAGRQQIVEEAEEEVCGEAQDGRRSMANRVKYDHPDDDGERGAARICVLFGQRS
jgi:hypothetical protein